MSEPKLISPMLDNFVMGDPISDHHGVRCCPAMPKDSDKKYIVKIISIPASQVQLDALLLTGAYPDPAAALVYFKELADGIAEEAKLLQKLSKLEGFLPYESCQLVPMEQEVGYDVYLLGSYKRTLERYFRKHTMTHLNAVNLGLDLCASMAVCRHAGLMYVDLKPSNIFVSDDQEFRIGDLGFVSLASLKYASLPDKYRSPYTPPEVQDAFSALNATMDIYAIGMILYQVYNDGKLPFGPEGPGQEPLAPPLYADYEMAEIILKACAPDPKARWQDPLKMGQALVDYMQRNGVNDVPIDPHAQVATPVLPEQTPEAPGEEEPEVLPLFTGTPDDIDLDEIKAAIAGESQPEGDPQLPEEPVVSQEPETAPEEATEAEASAEDPAPGTGEADGEPDPGDLSFLDQMQSDDTTPGGEDLGQIGYQELSDEASDILSHADDLIAHETPEPVVSPEPIDVPLPSPIAPEAEESSEENAEASILPADPEGPAASEPDPEGSVDTPKDEEDDEYYDEVAERKTGSSKSWLWILLTLLLVSCITVAAFFFYRNYYLQTIDTLAVNGSNDQIVVSLSSSVDESLLQVSCTDAHGNALHAAVVDGKATFTGLAPATQYKIRVDIEGFHKLTGNTTGNYNTPAQTNIVSFNAIAGSESGSVILTFTVDGPEGENWNVICSAEGEEAKTVTFTGHMVSVPGLTLGKLYTFRLTGSEELYLVGSDTLSYQVTDLQYAQNLAITGCENETLSVRWDAPEGTAVESWSVRCYNENGYDETQTVTETSATFENIDCTNGYTVEVTAFGMTVSARTFITANSVTVRNMNAELTKTGGCLISWDSTGTPEGGWLLVYSLDGLDRQDVIRCDGNSAQVPTLVPGTACEYTLQAADGTTVFGGAFRQEIPEATEPFNRYGVKSSNFSVRLCPTPTDAGWDHYDVKEEDYTDSFTVGQKASVVLKLNTQYNSSWDEVTTLFVFRDGDGNLVSYCSVAEAWATMWYNLTTRQYEFYCELDVPTLPEAPGSYTMEIFMDGSSICSAELQVIETE